MMSEAQRSDVTFFQLPLSGSRTLDPPTDMGPCAVFQLPLSGSLDELPAANSQPRSGFQLPLSGSHEARKARADIAE